MKTVLAKVGTCPLFILVPEHYRDDGTCRCDDEHHTNMHHWGYVWDGQRWRRPEEAKHIDPREADARQEKHPSAA